MSRGLVTLINPNFVQPSVTLYALDILTSGREGRSGLGIRGAEAGRPAVDMSATVWLGIA